MLQTSKTPRLPKVTNRKPPKTQIEKLRAIAARFLGQMPRPEYPRPQFVRPEWQCLNGVWEFTFDPNDMGRQNRWEEKQLPHLIIVPFAPQSELSGVCDRQVYPVVWYARWFEVPSEWRTLDQNVLLHFGAVDYRCTIWVNGQEVGHNQGGHVPFSFDIVPYLQNGPNRLCVRVEDPQDPAQPRGKQSVGGGSQGIHYWNTTGIWQSVWLEPVPQTRIQELRLTPLVGADASQDALEAVVYLHAPAVGWHLEIEALDGEQVVARTENDAVGAVARLRLEMPHAKRWSPDSPHLFDLRVRLSRNGHKLDEVASYFGLRSVALRDGALCLNDEPTYLKLVLDQGYWPDGGLTAPSDEALRFDVEACKRMGFNGVRKHQKVEDPRWLYHCDRLGLLVWGEMANARAWNPRAEELFAAEWERVIRRDYNHPCIVTWVPLNESWGVPDLQMEHAGQYAFVERAVALTRRADETRPVVSNDGWEHAGVTDIVGIHDYTPTGARLRKRYTLQNGEIALSTQTWGKYPRQVFARGATYAGQPVMLTEVGGFLNIPDLPKDKWDPLYNAYASTRTPEELLDKYRDLMEGIASLPFVSGFCYTQLTDVEQEINGLLTYDRKFKIEPERIAAIHANLFGSPHWAALSQWRSAQNGSLDGHAKNGQVATIENK